jgi:hypothetical protein
MHQLSEATSLWLGLRAAALLRGLRMATPVREDAWDGKAGGELSLMLLLLLLV